MGQWHNQPDRGGELATPRGTVFGILHILEDSARELERIGLAMSAERMRMLRGLVIAEYRWEESAEQPLRGTAGNDR